MASPMEILKKLKNVVAPPLGTGYAAEAADAAKKRNNKTKEIATALDENTPLPIDKQGSK